MTTRNLRMLSAVIALSVVGAGSLPEAASQVRGARGGGGGHHSGGSVERSTATRSTASRSTASRTTATRSTTSVHSSTAVRSSGSYYRGGAAVVSGGEGYAAVGRRGAVVKGEDGHAAVGRRGAVVAGEEGFAAVGRHGGVVVGHHYESYEGWRVAAGEGAAIAVGTMLARPPSAATVVVVNGTSYWRYQNTYYVRVYNGGAVAYQVVGSPY